MHDDERTSKVAMLVVSHPLLPNIARSLDFCHLLVVVLKSLFAELSLLVA
jgi:hypothetical protein